MDFREFQDRLMEHLRGQVDAAGLTERSLARLTGVSQPHLHQALRGDRSLSPAMADRLLRHLGLSLFDLCPDRLPTAVQPGWRAVAHLRQPLGPGLAWDERSTAGWVWVQQDVAARAACPVAMRLTPDTAMPRATGEATWALLDRSLGARTHLDAELLYAVEQHGEGRLRQLRREGAWLVLVAEDGSEERVRLAGTLPAEVVRARVLPLPPDVIRAE